MASASKIEWTEATWNPIVGCSIVSPGCTNCYAMRTAARMNANPATPHYHGTVQDSKAGPVWTGKVAMAPERVLLEPLKRRKPTTYFVNSMGDLFHESVPDVWIDKVFAVMALRPQHTFQVLTKRAERMRDYCSRLKDRSVEIAQRAVWLRIWDDPDAAARDTVAVIDAGALPNVWLGVSTERQQEADERIPHLLATPAAVRFISAEPLLGPLDIRQHLRAYQCHECFNGRTRVDGHFFDERCPSCNGSGVETPRLGLVIVGGENGPRPMHPDWVRSLRDQCAGADVPFFFKQWGSWLPGQNDIYPHSNDSRRVAHWQDGGWGPRDVSRGLLSRNYVMWESDGTAHRGDDRFRSDYFQVAAWAQRVGKKAAGRLLDGVEHNDMPRRSA